MLAQLLAWILALCVCAISTAGDGATIAVLYPDVREPFYSVFSAILQGIESRTKHTIKPNALAEDFNPSDLQTWIGQQKADAIIALGQRGLKAARSLQTRLPVVSGASLLTPQQVNGDSFYGISLAADPDRAFTLLKDLVPDVKQIFVVYAADDNNWLMRLAQRSARAHGLELHAYEVQDLRAAVRRYREILQDMRENTDALWLPLDSTTVDDKVVLPLVLEAAWERRLIVFSSSPAHAQRGALFSLFPNNFALGQHLADTALRMLEDQRGKSGRVVPLTDLDLAVNLRTAAHLGLRFSAEQQRDFNLVFPSP